MKIILQNKNNNKSYSVKPVDSEKELKRKNLRQQVIDADEGKEKDKEEDVELSKKDIESLKELVSLLPELKKLVKPEKESDKEKDKDKDEDEKDGDDKDEKEKEKKPNSKDSGEDDEELGEDDFVDESEFEELSEDDGVLLEKEDENFDQEDVDEDVLEDDCGENRELGDSVASIGSIEVNVADSDTLTKEEEVAKAFDSRYKNALRRK